MQVGEFVVDLVRGAHRARDGGAEFLAKPLPDPMHRRLQSGQRKPRLRGRFLVARRLAATRQETRDHLPFALAPVFHKRTRRARQRCIQQVCRPLAIKPAITFIHRGGRLETLLRQFIETGDKRTAPATFRRVPSLRPPHDVQQRPQQKSAESSPRTIGPFPRARFQQAQEKLLRMIFRRARRVAAPNQEGNDRRSIRLAKPRERRPRFCVAAEAGFSEQAPVSRGEEHTGSLQKIGPPGSPHFAEPRAKIPRALRAAGR